MKLSSQTIGSGGTEWSVPVFKSSDKSWIHRTVVSNTRFRWNRVIGSSFQVMRKVVGFMELSSQTLGSGGTEWSVPVFRSCEKSLDSWSCIQYHSVPVEPSGRFQFSQHQLHMGKRAYGADKTVLLMSCVLTVRNCLYHCTVVEAIGVRVDFTFL